MKISNIISILSGLLLMAGITACEGEKDLIIIDGDLPIKTSTLYMIGDATPNGWSLDAATLSKQVRRIPSFSHGKAR